MSARTRNWIAIVGGGLLVVYAVTHCGRAAPGGERRAAPARRSGHVVVTPAPNLESTVATSVSTVAVAAHDQAFEQAIAHTESVISVPAGGGDEQRGALLPPLVPSPAIELAHHIALIAWQREVEQHLAHCLPRTAAAPAPTPMTVFFAPSPRDANARAQVLLPSWVRVAPEALKRLWQRASARDVEACLGQVRMLALTVPLTGDAVAHELPASAENLSIEL